MTGKFKQVRKEITGELVEMQAKRKSRWISKLSDIAPVGTPSFLGPQGYRPVLSYSDQ